MPPPLPFVYIVRCADGTLYTGYAVDLDKRLRAHNQGRGAKYTAGRRPVALVYAAACGSKSDALKRERQIKRWPRVRKEALVVSSAGPAYNPHMPVTLTPRERARLKARAHPLEPLVRVGQAGLSDSLVSEVDRALAVHQLVKVRLDNDDREAREAQGNALSDRTDAAIVQRVGKIIVLWRPRPDEA